jgi:hypothetical protein
MEVIDIANERGAVNYERGLARSFRLIAHGLECEGDAAANRACRIYQVNSLPILA